MSLKRIYSITWNRQGEEPGEQCCHALTAERLVTRLRGAIRNSGPITIHAVEHDWGEVEPEIFHGDLWDAYVAGAKDGQRHPAATESDLNRGADGYVKLWAEKQK